MGRSFAAIIARLRRVAVGPVTAAMTWPVWSQAQPPPGPGPSPYGPGMMWGGWHGGLFGPLFMILLLVGVVALVGFMTRWFASPTHGSPPSRTPLDILKERYARGEIDKEEYEERRRVLRD